MAGLAFNDPADPLLTVVIPTLGRSTLSAQLAALERCTWSHGWEILAVDNGSGGRTLETCSQWVSRLPHLRYVDGTARRGRSHAINVGSRAARGRWLLFCDDDDLVEPDFVSAVGEEFVEKEAQAVVFNVNVRTMNAPHVWQSYHHEELEGGRPMFRSIPAFWGCAGIERDLFLSLGGFDETCAYAEDLAFSVRLSDAGVEPIWVPRQLLNYRLRSSPRARFRQRVQVVRSVQAIARQHPDVASPVTGKRLGHLVKGLVLAVPSAPKMLTRRGRLEYANQLGGVWGLFIAMGEAP